MLKKIAAIIAALALVYGLLSVITINTTIEEHDQVTRIVNDTTTEENCSMEEHYYQYAWDGWHSDAEKGLLMPSLLLVNMEDRTGEFNVRFAFINEDHYPYSEYKDRADEVVPEFYSEMKSFQMHPYQDLTVSIPTKIRNYSTGYWATADIRPPKFRYCVNVESTSEKEMTEDVTRMIEKKITLLDYITSRRS